MTPNQRQAQIYLAIFNLGVMAACAAAGAVAVALVPGKTGQLLKAGFSLLSVGCSSCMAVRALWAARHQMRCASCQGELQADQADVHEDHHRFWEGKLH